MGMTALWLTILTMFPIMANEGTFWDGPGDYVTRKETAIRIADAVFIENFGESMMSVERPLLATETPTSWIVKGTLRQAPPGVIIAGGVARIQINKKSGCIEELDHGQ